ncbi:hypothetical protein [Aquimarina algiphila]|uniref:hypothetical protein n=1 Tax=Aquimarina algiphila TaxID=2047982 RepID=UPI00233152B9|nr:hypothetical protein [Aquimarina algiphila]
MKSEQLTIDKFEITKLQNGQKINGGMNNINGDGETTDLPRCVDGSKRWILEESFY